MGLLMTWPLLFSKFCVPALQMPRWLGSEAQRGKIISEVLRQREDALDILTYIIKLFSEKLLQFILYQNACLNVSC